MKATYLAPALLLTLSAPAFAQNTQTLTLPSAVARAASDGPEVSTARAELRNAEAEVRATRADPSPLITSLTQVEQAQTAALAGLQQRLVQFLGEAAGLAGRGPVDAEADRYTGGHQVGGAADAIAQPGVRRRAVCDPGGGGREAADLGVVRS